MSHKFAAHMCHVTLSHGISVLTHSFGTEIRQQCSVDPVQPPPVSH